MSRAASPIRHTTPALAVPVAAPSTVNTGDVIGAVTLVKTFVVTLVRLVSAAKLRVVEAGSEAPG
eukprot:7982130-Pyramimonas_sp.AAC.1